MVRTILSLLFPAALVLIPVVFKKPTAFMRRFRRAMVEHEDARKFYIRVLVLVLLAYHFVIMKPHSNNWGFLVSSIPVFVMLSVKRAERILFFLKKNRCVFGGIAMLSIVLAVHPQLLPTSVTLSLILSGGCSYILPQKKNKQGADEKKNDVIKNDQNTETI